MMRDAAPVPMLPERYVRTSVSKEIESAVQYARTMQAPVVIRGPAGIGKSSSLAAICKSDDLANVVEVVQSKKALKPLLKSVIVALGYYVDREHIAALYDILLSRMHSEARRGGFLIVDEVQNAGVDGIRELLHMQEQTGIPLILAGNPAAIKRTNANAAVFEQVADRVYKWVELSLPQPEDIRDIAMSWGVEGLDAFSAVVAYGQHTSIRQTVALLRLCRNVAGNGPIHLNHIRSSVAFATGDHGKADVLLKVSSR